MSTSYPQPENLKEAYRNYLASKMYSRSSIKNYVSDVAHFLGWIGTTYTGNSGSADLLKVLRSQKRETAIRYRGMLIQGNTPKRTINRKLAALRHFSIYLITTRGIDFNLTENIENVHLHPKNKNYPLTIEYTKHLKNSNFANNTIKNYTSDINHFLSWLNILAPAFIPKIDDNKISEYDNLLNNIKSQSTRKRKLSALNNFFDWARSNNLASNNPFKKKIIESCNSSSTNLYTDSPVTSINSPSLPVVRELQYTMINKNRLSISKPLLSGIAIILTIANIYFANSYMHPLGIDYAAKIAKTGDIGTIDFQNSALYPLYTTEVSLSAMGLNTTADSSSYTLNETLAANVRDVKIADDNIDSVYILKSSDSISEDQSFTLIKNLQHDPSHTSSDSVSQNPIYNSIDSTAFLWDGLLFQITSPLGYDRENPEGLSPTIDNHKIVLTSEILNTQIDIESADANDVASTGNIILKMVNQSSQFLIGNILDGAKYTGGVASRIVNLIGLPGTKNQNVGDINFAADAPGIARVGTSQKTNKLAVLNTNGQDVVTIDENGKVLGSGITKNKVADFFRAATDISSKDPKYPTDTNPYKQFFENLDQTEYQQMALIKKIIYSRSDANQDIQLPGEDHEVILGSTAPVFGSNYSQGVLYFKTYGSQTMLITAGTTSIDDNGNLTSSKSNVF